MPCVCVIRLASRQLMPTVSDFVAAMRNGSAHIGWAGAARTYYGAVAHPVAQDEALNKRSGSFFLVSQLDYLRDHGGLEGSGQLAIHYVCTETFDTDWRRLLTRFERAAEPATSEHAPVGSATGATEPSADARLVACPKAAAGSGSSCSINVRANETQGHDASTLLSADDAAFVRRCLYPWDAKLHQALCGDRIQRAQLNEKAHSNVKDA